MEHYIGMDAHSKTCMFVVVNGRGQEIRSQRVNTSEVEILNFIGSLKGKKHLTFEECTFARWLHLLLKDQVDELVVCNPLFISKRKGPKNDYLDALHLAQQLRGGFLTPVFHEDSYLSDLRKVMASYENLTSDTIRAKCRFKALFTARGIPTPGQKIYSGVGTAIEKLDSTSQFVARRLLDQIQYFKDMKVEYINLFNKNIDEYPQIKILTTLPGISTVRANIIAAAVVDPRRFANKFKFWSYCMLVKHDRQSDGKSYGKVTIFGKKILKWVYMSAATDAIQNSGMCKEYYELQITEGVSPKAARKNVARKLAAITLAIMKTGKPYEEKRLTKNSLKLSEVTGAIDSRI